MALNLAYVSPLTVWSFWGVVYEAREEGRGGKGVIRLVSGGGLKN